MTHHVRIVTEDARARGVCVCGWASPWRTNRSPWHDRVVRAAPPSPAVLAERAAHNHVRRTPARRRRPGRRRYRAGCRPPRARRRPRRRPPGHRQASASPVYRRRTLVTTRSCGPLPDGGFVVMAGTLAAGTDDGPVSTGRRWLAPGTGHRYPRRTRTRRRYRPTPGRRAGVHTPGTSGPTDTGLVRSARPNIAGSSAPPTRSPATSSTRRPGRVVHNDTSSDHPRRRNGFHPYGV
jgi:hypothetical protein